MRDQRKIIFAGFFFVILFVTVLLQQTSARNPPTSRNGVHSRTDAAEQQTYLATENYAFDYEKFWDFEPSQEACLQRFGTVVTVVDPLQVRNVPSTAITAFEGDYYKISPTFFCYSGPYLYLPKTKTEKELSIIKTIQNELTELHSNCDSSRRGIHYQFLYNGFGAQITDISKTLMIGWKKHRTLILHGTWNYAGRLSEVFQPLSKCGEDTDVPHYEPFTADDRTFGAQFVSFVGGEVSPYFNYAPSWIHRKYQELGLPLLFSQFVGRLITLNEKGKAIAQEPLREIHFDALHNCIGFHIRRSDKSIEMKFKPYEDWHFLNITIATLQAGMTTQPELLTPALSAYIKNNEEIPIFISTEDGSSVENFERIFSALKVEIGGKLKRFKAIYTHNERDNSMKHSNGQLKLSLANLVAMEKCDMIVGTFSSGWSRLIYYNAMYQRKVTPTMISLDFQWWFQF